ncbi:hypothetical protein DRJ19_05760 [Candidatus Woesearchaeota archaeon]|nr:MAG: hypothetical protein DRJ19_05760 [Candidatus Woesearchaeota archaeon]
MEEVIEVPMEKLRPNPWNVNFLLENERVKLRDEMARHGARAVPPIIVREKNGVYEIVDGEQRWRIARELGWKNMPAIVKDFTDDEVRELCLSYNVLRGRVDWFRLAEIMAEESERGIEPSSVYGGILDADMISALLALNRFDERASRILRKLHRETGVLTLEHIAVIVRFPSKYQLEIAQNLYALKGAGVDDLKDALRRYIKERPAEVEAAEKREAEGPAEKAEEEKPPRGEEVGAEEEEAEAEEKEAEEYWEEEEEEGAEEVVEAAEKKAVYFICKCGIRYKIDFEEKTIEKVTERERSEVFQSESPLPAVLEVECPRCHARGKIDVHDAKVEWTLT